MQELARGGLQLVASDGCAGRGQGHEGSRFAARASGDSAAVEDSSGKALQTIMAQKWTITSTMIDFPQEDYSTLESIKVTGGVVPDAQWQQNHNLFMGAVIATAKLGVKYLSMHAGFIDESNKAYVEKIYSRIRDLANIAADNGVILLLETGQESAKDLQHFLETLDHQSVGVNFDPANMILYDKGDPIEAVRVLSPWIRHLHVKDAIRTSKPGTWGAEVPWGDGQVGVKRFLDVLDEVGFEGAMAIEREAGDNRFGDIKLAIERLTAACK